MAKRKERRRFPRLDVRVRVRYKILTNGEEHVTPDYEEIVEGIYTRNLSIDGICMHTGRTKIKPGSVLALDIKFPELDKPIYAVGKVIWTKDIMNAGQFFSGVEFISMKVKFFDQLLNLLARHFSGMYEIEDETARRNLRDMFIQFLSKKKYV